MQYFFIWSIYTRGPGTNRVFSEQITEVWGSQNSEYWNCCLPGYVMYSCRLVPVLWNNLLSFLLPWGWRQKEDVAWYIGHTMKAWVRVWSAVLSTGKGPWPNIQFYSIGRDPVVNIKRLKQQMRQNFAMKMDANWTVYSNLLLSKVSP